jgi:hypothetical protein
MRRFLATPILATLIGLASVGAAGAAPTVVNVRIEGASTTLFEGPVRTEGHAIKAHSEAEAHPCDGTNGGKHATPGATPTAAAVDAMSIIDEPFDGKWFPGFHDFLISSFGSEASEHWGVFVNATFTDTGGCQIELTEGSRVLWGSNAAKVGAGARFLSLSLNGETLGAAVPSTTVVAGTPLTVTVQEYVSGKEGVEATPVPATGAEVSPVATAMNGVQTTETANPESVLSGASGTAQITFASVGWRRLKASLAGAVRSNRLDVCVVAHAGETCKARPDDEIRSVSEPPPAEEPPKEEPPKEEPPKEEPPAEELPKGPPSGGEHPATNSSGEATTSGGGQAPPQQPPASAGSSGVSGTISAAPPRLRLDGLILTPLDDRASSLRYRGRWHQQSETRAFQGTVTVGGVGAGLSVHLAAGRAVLIVRDVRHRARVLLRVGAQHERLTIPASAAASSRPIVLPRRPRAGTLTLQILEGTVGIDGVAVTP